ncbi:MAG TPA: 4-hydroxythreonine-4-phosphate dehydrogenase PdxA [Acidisphaera sp.]|nr:4-hydroxythreonine-4-phosphate dehydrogenase PdxA [Acidisphaera sp.]
MAGSASSGSKTVLALAIGDPAGIGPELAAKLAADAAVRGAAELIIVGDRRVFDRACGIAGVSPDLPTARDDQAAPAATYFVDLGHLDPDSIKVGVASREGGAFALANYRTCLKLAASGRAGAVCFTPFNKAANRMAHPPYDDEISYTEGVLGIDVEASEFNILEGLWNARVTSHVPLSAVAALIKRDAVLRRIRLTDTMLRGSGIAKPRIAVAGLNPHAGDGGNFGHEDEAEILPAVRDAIAEGIEADGPFPPDTVFLRAKRGDFDAVLTMYHDQGQIAMKLLGFDHGVTLLAGFPFPICTPAHGSAYDIAGKGIANLGASRAALLLAARMAG